PVSRVGVGPVRRADIDPARLPDLGRLAGGELVGDRAVRRDRPGLPRVELGGGRPGPAGIGPAGGLPARHAPGHSGGLTRSAPPAADQEVRAGWSVRNELRTDPPALVYTGSFLRPIVLRSPRRGSW